MAPWHAGSVLPAQLNVSTGIGLTRCSLLLIPRLVLEGEPHAQRVIRHLCTGLRQQYLLEQQVLLRANKLPRLSQLWVKSSFSPDMQQDGVERTGAKLRTFSANPFFRYHSSLRLSGWKGGVAEPVTKERMHQIQLMSRYGALW